MTETPDTASPDDIPDEPPPAGAGVEVDDEPLGVQEDSEDDDASLPGLPEGEPPASG